MDALKAGGLDAPNLHEWIYRSELLGGQSKKKRTRAGGLFGQKVKFGGRCLLFIRLSTELENCFFDCKEHNVGALSNHVPGEVNRDKLT